MPNKVRTVQIYQNTAADDGSFTPVNTSEESQNGRTKSRENSDVQRAHFGSPQTLGERCSRTVSGGPTMSDTGRQVVGAFPRDYD